MVLIHINIHASQRNPFVWYDGVCFTGQLNIKICNGEKIVRVKKLNTDKYKILEKQDDNGITFHDDYYYTFETEIENVELLNLVFTLHTNNELIGTGNVEKHHLHNEVYGFDARTDIFQAKEKIGMLNFDYLILPSATTYDLSACGDNKRFDAFFNEFIYMGHRGSGSTVQRTSPWLENTINSFVNAHEQGASFVELDVQLTKDLVPIVFHDDFAAIIEDKEGCQKIHHVPVKDLTYQDLCHKKIDFARPDAGLNYDHRFKSLFPTLRELLEKAPSNLGIFMEIKYPEPDQNIDNLIRKDVVVDRILEEMSKLTIRQPIMFCSFDPEICLMLKHKQDWYPVFYITVGENCFTSSNPWAPLDMRSRTRGFAANFAICHGLKGISINADPLMNSKTDIMTLTSYLKEHNKLLFSWGAANCHGEYAEIQKSVQMAGVISDKLYNLNIARST